MPGPSDYGPSLAMTLTRPVNAYFGETKPKCSRSFRGRVIADSLGVSSQQADQQPTYAQIIAYLEVDRIFGCAYICAEPMPQPETNRNKVVARLERDCWVGRHGGDHDVYKHPARPGRIIVPRHRTLSLGVARAIAKVADWQA